MANFFGKPKPATAASPSQGKAKARDGEDGSSGHMSTQSDFQKTFRPFALKKDAELAPVNWFRERRRREKRRQTSGRTDGDVIIVDDDESEGAEDIEMVDAEECEADLEGEYRS